MSKGKKNIRVADKPSKLRKNLRLIRKRLTAVVVNSINQFRARIKD